MTTMSHQVLDLHTTSSLAIATRPGAILGATLGLLLSVPTQAQGDGIAVPGMRVRNSSGTWFGDPCPQPGAWYNALTATVASGSVITARVDFFPTSNANVPYMLAFSPTLVAPIQLPGVFVGPFLLDPAAFFLVTAGPGGPLSMVGSCYGYGITHSATVSLPPGTAFYLQAVAPDFIPIFSPPIRVNVQ